MTAIATIIRTMIPPPVREAAVCHRSCRWLRLLGPARAVRTTWWMPRAITDRGGPWHGGGRLGERGTGRGARVLVSPKRARGGLRHPQSLLDTPYARRRGR